MKCIVKANEPDDLAQWRRKRNARYENMPADIRGRVKDSLIREQGFLCCYCEIGISADDSHIEHVRPRSACPSLSLDYGNLLCSCQKNVSRQEPLHCGNAKADWHDAASFVSPLDEGCEDRFTFTLDGFVRPIEGDEAAKETVARLNLNCSKLRQCRAAVIKPFCLEALSEEDLCVIVHDYLEQKADGAFNGFWTTIRYLFS